MAKILQRIATNQDYYRSIVSITDPNNMGKTINIDSMIKSYIDIIHVHYTKICNAIFKSRASFSYPEDGDYADDFQKRQNNHQEIIKIKNRYVDYCNRHGEDVNKNTIMDMYEHVLDILFEYNACKENDFTKEGFFDYAWSQIEQDLDIGFSCKNTESGVLCKINFPVRTRCGINWAKWFGVSLDRRLIPAKVNSFNVDSKQDLNKLSQKMLSSRLTLTKDGYKLHLRIKRETPEKYNTTVTVGIDLGLNSFMFYHCEDSDGKEVLIEACKNTALLDQYKCAVDSGEDAAITKSLNAIMSYLKNDIKQKIQKFKPRFIAFENLGDSLMNSDNVYSNHYPWNKIKTRLKRIVEEEGIHVIYIDFYNTSHDYAHGDDEIIRDEKDFSIGYCKKSHLPVNCDENAAYNIWGRCNVEILYRYCLSEEQVSEVKEFIAQRGYSPYRTNYKTAKEVLDFCKENYGILCF